MEAGQGVGPTSGRALRWRRRSSLCRWDSGGGDTGGAQALPSAGGTPRWDSGGGDTGGAMRAMAGKVEEDRKSLGPETAQQGHPQTEN